MLAAAMGHSDIVRALLGRGATVHATTPEGDTALMVAAFVGKLDIVTFLITNGALVINKNKDGATALDVARHRGHADIVDYLEPIFAGQFLNGRWCGASGRVLEIRQQSPWLPQGRWSDPNASPPGPWGWRVTSVNGAQVMMEEQDHRSYRFGPTQWEVNWRDSVLGHQGIRYRRC
jgi:hypothetical protein